VVEEAGKNEQQMEALSASFVADSQKYNHLLTANSAVIGETGTV
jgi:hypothetical protein